MTATGKNRNNAPLLVPRWLIGSVVGVLVFVVLLGSLSSAISPNYNYSLDECFNMETNPVLLSDLRLWRYTLLFPGLLSMELINENGMINFVFATPSQEMAMFVYVISGLPFAFIGALLLSEGCWSGVAGPVALLTFLVLYVVATIGIYILLPYVCMFLN